MYLRIKSYDCLTELVVEVWEDRGPDGDSSLLDRSYLPWDARFDDDVLAQIEATATVLTVRAGLDRAERAAYRGMHSAS